MASGLEWGLSMSCVGSGPDARWRCLPLQCYDVMDSSRGHMIKWRVYMCVGVQEKVRLLRFRDCCRREVEVHYAGRGHRTGQSTRLTQTTRLSRVNYPFGCQCWEGWESWRPC